MEERISTLASISAAHFSAHLDKVRLKSGKVTERIRMDHPVASAVLPITGENEIIMVWQYRYALGKDSLEIPAGKVDPGESPLDCAGRELMEETGYRAEKLEEIFEYYPAIGYSNEIIKIFVGTGLEKMGGRIDEEEISKVEIIPMDRVKEMILKGRIRDSKTVLGIALLQKLKW